MPIGFSNQHCHGKAKLDVNVESLDFYYFGLIPKNQAAN